MAQSDWNWKKGMVTAALVMLLLAGTSVIYAAEDSENVFDPLHPETFDYQSGDYAAITDWSVVAWEKIPAGRITDVPPEKLAYTKLSGKQRRAMTAAQIALNFDRIEDLKNDVHAEKARAAIRKRYNIDVRDFGKGDEKVRIRNNRLEVVIFLYSKREMPSDEGVVGESINLASPTYQKGFVQITDDGLLVFTLLEDAELSGIENDRLWFRAPSNLAWYKGHSIKNEFMISRGRIFLGGINVKNALIDGIEFDETSREEVFFEGEPCVRKCVSFDKEHKRVVLSFEDSKSTIRFGEVLDRFHHARPGKNIEIKPVNGRIILENRNDAGNIPLVQIAAGANGKREVFFSNFGHQFMVENEKIMAQALGGDASAPMRLALVDADGRVQENLFFDAHGNAAIPDKTKPELIEQLERRRRDRDYDFGKSRVLLNRQKAQLKKYGITLVGKDADELRTITAFAGMAEQMTPALRTGLRIFLDKEATGISDIILSNIKATGMASPFSKEIIIFKPDERNMELLSHEAAHILTFQIADTEEAYEPLFPGEEERPFWSLPEEEKQRVRMRKEFARAHAGTLKSRWEEVGTPYGEHTGWFGAGFVGTSPSGKWDKKLQSSSETPLFGCIRAYGCGNIYEDIATMTDAVYTRNYATLQDVVNPHSPFYKKMMKQQIGETDVIMTPEIAQEWAHRYRTKLDLLAEYGFITKDQHEKAIGIKSK